MMIERHYEDEALIALMESDGEGSDEHVPSCATCSEKLESVRMIAGALRDETVWTESSFERPVPATIAALRAAAMQMEDEDAEAERVVSDLLAGPREFWRAQLDARPEYRTAGVVRKLIAASDRALDTMPVDALEMTTLGADIADGLDSAGMSSSQLEQLRGSVRRQRAYALFYTGNFADALIETERADAHLAACAVDAYERARLGIVRAVVLRAMERWTAGIEVAREAVRVFDEFADLDRGASARLAEAHLLFSRRDFEQAVTILHEQESLLRSSEYVETHARILMNLGYAYWQLGNVPEALNYYDAASEILLGIGIETEAARVRWGVATMLADAGYREQALGRLRQVASEFERRGMASESALAGLGIAELLLAEQRFAEVEEICQRAMRSFERAGVSYTARALTALAYMRETAHNRSATPLIVRHVRDYIRRLPADENVLFAPL